MDAATDDIRRYDHVLISIVAWIGVLVGTCPQDETVVRAFLAGFERIHTDQGVAGEAGEVRR